MGIKRENEDVSSIKIFVNARLMLQCRIQVYEWQTIYLVAYHLC